MEDKQILGKELLQQWKDGKDEAYDEVYKLYYPIVYHRALYFFCDTQKAQDATQNVFLEVYLKFKSIRDINAFPGWIKTITYRKCINMTSYDKKDSLFYINDQELENQGNTKNPITINNIHMKDAVDMVKKQLLTIDEPKRTIGILYFLEGYSTKEISEFLEINVNTVFSHIHRIRQTLIKELDNNKFSIKDCLSAASLPAFSTAYQEYVMESITSLKAPNTKSKIKKSHVKHVSTSLAAKIVIGAILCVGVINVATKEQVVKHVQSYLHLDNKTEIVDIKYPNSITKEDIQITIQTTNDNYDTTLIDGKETASITENGIYQVSIQKDGKEMDTRQVVIDNIDKSGPYIAEKKENEKECILKIEDNHAINYSKTEVYANDKIAKMQLDKDTGSIALPKESGVSYHLIVFDQVGNMSDFYVNFYE